MKELGLINEIQTIEVGGKNKFEEKIKGLKEGATGFNDVISMGIIRDADDNPKGTFDSICSVLDRINLPKPEAPQKPAAGSPQVTIMIVPDEYTTGMIENICLNSVNDDPAMECVNEFFDCLKARKRVLSENVIPKARVRAFLASCEWLEIAHFEYLQKCMANYEFAIPISEALAVPKVHTFLASRYTPNLSLGIAAQKSDDEDRYWNFSHPAFDNIKQFLQML